MNRQPSPLRLGVNIDHVATIRNARGGLHPSPLRAAHAAAAAGADGITAHLREDRRHMTDGDIAELIDGVALPLNLEMAATDEMLAIALARRPHAACIVPERRAERTTEGGLDVAGGSEQLRPFTTRLAAAGIRVSLFIAPDLHQVEAAAALGVPVVELHTGPYAHAVSEKDVSEQIARLRTAAARASALGLEVHAGHGLTYANVAPVAAITDFRELNIGHFLIGEAVFIGLDAAIRDMRRRMTAARAQGPAL
ncbi:MAG: pyridoxine 5'-phosphate synthase [Sphingomonadaceae bacterium]